MLAEQGQGGHSPTDGDVVVFGLNKDGSTLVKRLGLWPDGSVEKERIYFLTGDNDSINSPTIVTSR